MCEPSGAYKKPCPKCGRVPYTSHGIIKDKDGKETYFCGKCAHEWSES